MKEGASRVGDEIVNTNNTRVIVKNNNTREIEVFENFAGQPRSVRTNERKEERGRCVRLSVAEYVL